MQQHKRGSRLMGLAFGLFFVVLFAAGSAFNIWQQDYVQAAGFGLLALSNLVPLLLLREQPPQSNALPGALLYTNEHDSDQQQATAQEDRLNRLSNGLAFLGIGLVILGWFVL